MIPESSVTVRFAFHVARPSKRIRIRDGRRPGPSPDGSVPRIARLLALAHHYQDLLERRAVGDYASLARLTGVTRTRITQVMNLLFLAPDIQEEILFMPRTIKGDDPISERTVRPLTVIASWDDQRERWRAIARPNASEAASGSRE
ncbi:hypothetical protein HY251_18565 [bacterium]|nr:hypothetical protein [bacterium]